MIVLEWWKWEWLTDFFTTLNSKKSLKSLLFVALKVFFVDFFLLYFYHVNLYFSCACRNCICFLCVICVVLGVKWTFERVIHEVSWHELSFFYAKHEVVDWLTSDEIMIWTHFWVFSFIHIRIHFKLNNSQNSIQKINKYLFIA